MMDSKTMKSYRVPCLSAADDVLTIPRARIDEAPWGGTYRPRSEAAVGWLPDGLEVLLTCWEVDPRTTESAPNADVYKDSCLEFFLTPYPEVSDAYLNFEFNSRGTLLLGCDGPEKERIRLAEAEGSLFAIRPLRLDGGRAWGIRFHIPFSFLESRFGPPRMLPGHAFRGNFQKCGDLCAVEHYLSWNPIDAPQPDFHRRECFGALRVDPF